MATAINTLDIVGDEALACRKTPNPAQDTDMARMQLQLARGLIAEAMVMVPDEAQSALYFLDMAIKALPGPEDSTKGDE